MLWLPTYRFAQIAALALCTVAILMFAACAGGSDGIKVTKLKGLSCVDDSKHCIQERQYALSRLLADNSYGWVSQRPTANAYATGVRLFAFQKKKKSLSCANLKRGQLEAQNARSVLRSSGKHLTPAQIARGAILGTEVSRELKREIRRRCR